MSKQEIPKQISGGKKQGQSLRAIRKHWFGGRCMHINEDDTQCSKTKNLELAHGIDTELSKQQPHGFRSSFERLKDTMENPECFLLFCRVHHREFDGRDADEWKAEFYGGKN